MAGDLLRKQGAVVNVVLGALRGHERDGDERQHDLEELHLA
jgi:hypothetical protein